MFQHGRREFLKLVGAATIAGGMTSVTTADKPTKGRIRKLGHSLLSNPPGGYAEGDVRDEGDYAVLGSFDGPAGSFLVDIDNPTEPEEVHVVPSAKPPSNVGHADVKFDNREGLYYRSLEGANTGFEVIDYDFEEGEPEDPVILASADAGSTHNLFPHPEEPILYTVNEGGEGAGVDVFDVSDPANPVSIGDFGPEGDVHDIVVDPDDDLAHVAYLGGEKKLDAYVIFDVDDPKEPTELGRFDYADRPDYSEKRLENGEPGFEACHYANYDPEREIAVVGDEIAFGFPGGKHVFDIGWDEGSPSEPKHIGFTYSPNAEEMKPRADNLFEEAFDWTGHNFDIIPKGDTTLLVSGDYHEGTVVYDLSDPTDPTPSDQYRTDDGATDEVNDNPILDLGEAPMAWGADWIEDRDIVVTSDFFTGIYTFKVTPAREREEEDEDEEEE